MLFIYAWSYIIIPWFIDINDSKMYLKQFWYFSILYMLYFPEIPVIFLAYYTVIKKISSLIFFKQIKSRLHEHMAPQRCFSSKIRTFSPSLCSILDFLFLWWATLFRYIFQLYSILWLALAKLLIMNINSRGLFKISQL